MAFIPVVEKHAGVIPHEEMPCGNIATHVGMAMVLTSGKLAKCGAEVKPEYICMQENKTAVAAGTPVPVIPVSDDVIFETVFSASAASVAIGGKVTIATDGLRVTGTTTNGVAEVLSMEGTASGSKCRVKF